MKQKVIIKEEKIDWLDTVIFYICLFFMNLFWYFAPAFLVYASTQSVVTALFVGSAVAPAFIMLIYGFEPQKKTVEREVEIVAKGGKKK